MALEFNPLTGKFDSVVKDHTLLLNIGTNTHAQIDTHIAGTGTSVHGDTFLLNTGDIGAGDYQLDRLSLGVAVDTNYLLKVNGSTYFGSISSEFLDTFIARTTATSGGKTKASFQLNVVPGAANSTLSATAIAGLLNMQPTAGYVISGTSRGMQFTVQNSGGGTVSTARSLEVGVTNTGGGVVTNGYGLYGNAIAGTNSWFIYQSGTERNTLNGSLGIGIDPLSTTALYINKSMGNSGSYYGEYIDINAGSADGTSTAVGGYFRAKTIYSQTKLVGLTGTTYFDGTGKTLGSAVGLDFTVQNVNGTTTTATSINCSVSNSGAIGTYYGINLNKTGAGTYTTVYPIYENIGLGENYFKSNMHLDGDLNHDGTNIGFFGTAPTTKQTALTSADASAVNSGDATTDTVINNMRTRINELETKLQAYGLLQ